MSKEKQIDKKLKQRQDYLKFKPFADDLRKAESWCELDGVLNRYQTVKNLSKMGYRKQEWISVEERLPEPFVSVLVYMPDEVPFPTVREGFVNKRGEWYAGGFDRLPDEVIMWREMPEAPKMRKEDEGK